MSIARLKDYRGPALLSYGFRPFFFFGSVYAGAVILVWLPAFYGTLQLGTALAPRDWHVHEMLFGYIAAVVAGFLLTAVPNWTGRLPLQGRPLFLLFSTWVAGRIAVSVSAWIGWGPAAAIDSLFLILLAAAAAREIIAGRKWGNLQIIVIVSVLAGGNLAFHLEAHRSGLAEYSTRGGVAMLIVLIALIGGRIIPSFTRNWMTKQGITRRLPTQPTRYDLAVVISTGAALLSWTVAPDARSVGALLMAVGAGQVLRLLRWGGLRSARDPLVFILHLGYFWVPAGLLMLGASIVDTGIPRSAAIHALTAGAMPTMILAVMTRAILGHTGRQLAANSQTVLIYGLITLGALVRVATPLGILDYSNGMQMAALMWAGAFVLFLIAYGPILFRPSLGQT